MGDIPGLLSHIKQDKMNNFEKLITVIKSKQ